MPYPYVGIKYRDSEKHCHHNELRTNSTYRIPKAYNCDYKWRKHQCYSRRVVREQYWWRRWRLPPQQRQRWRYQHARIVHMGRILIKGSSNGIFAPLSSATFDGQTQKHKHICVRGVCVWVWRTQRKISIVIVDARAVPWPGNHAAKYFRQWREKSK